MDEDLYPAPEPIDAGTMPPVPGPAGSSAPRIAIVVGAVALGLVLVGLVRSITARSAGTDTGVDSEEAEE